MGAAGGVVGGVSGVLRLSRVAQDRSGFPDDTPRVMLEKHEQVAQDIRGFVEGKNFPKESLYRSGVR